MSAINSRLAKRPAGDTVRDTFIYSQQDDCRSLSSFSEHSGYTATTDSCYSHMLNDLEDRLNKIETIVANLIQQYPTLSEKSVPCQDKDKDRI